MNTELMEALNVLEKEKNIRKEVVLKAIEESLVQAYKHHFGKSDNIVVNMDYNTGEYEINMAKEVVENVEDQQTPVFLMQRFLTRGLFMSLLFMVKVHLRSFTDCWYRLQKQLSFRSCERKKIVLFMSAIN